MAKVRSIRIRFRPSGSPDVLSYKMYYIEHDPTGVDTLDYSSPSVDLGLPVADADGYIRVDVSTLGLFSDGRYDFGIVAVDDAGNESSMTTILDYPFDFVAPDAPTDLAVEVI